MFVVLRDPSYNSASCLADFVISFKNFKFNLKDLSTRPSNHFRLLVSASRSGFPGSTLLYHLPKRKSQAMLAANQAVYQTLVSLLDDQPDFNAVLVLTIAQVRLLDTRPVSDQPTIGPYSGTLTLHLRYCTASLQIIRCEPCGFVDIVGHRLFPRTLNTSSKTTS